MPLGVYFLESLFSGLAAASRILDLGAYFHVSHVVQVEEYQQSHWSYPPTHPLDDSIPEAGLPIDPFSRLALRNCNSSMSFEFCWRNMFTISPSKLSEVHLETHAVELSVDYEPSPLFSSYHSPVAFHPQTSSGCSHIL